MIVVSVLGALAGTGHADLFPKGIELNGIELNGIELNGIEPNGIELNGVELNGVELNGIQINGIQINGSELTGTLAGHAGSTCSHSELSGGSALPSACSKCAEIVSSADSYCSLHYWDNICVNEAMTMCTVDVDDFVGATFTATDANGGTVTLRLDAVATVPDPTPHYAWVYSQGQWMGVNTSVNENADVKMYTVSWYRPGTWRCTSKRCYYLPSNWYPICPGYDRDGYWNRALAIPGQWASCEGPGCGGRSSDEGFVFACRDVGATAKCVERLGYKPWKEITECTSSGYCWDTTLADHHEACVRMLRADYCGNGVPHAVNGTPINVWDAVGVQYWHAWDPDEWGLEDYGVGFEAEWYPGGAVAVSQLTRGTEDPSGPGGTTVESYLNATCPEVIVRSWGTPYQPRPGDSERFYPTGAGPYALTMSETGYPASSR